MGFACSHASWEFCSPLFPADCCHFVFVIPCQSLLFHFSLFSVMARFRTVVVFSTQDSLFLFWNDHEDERDTLCIVPELKEAASSDVDNLSSPFSSSASPSEDECSRLPLINHSFVFLFTSHFLGVLKRTFATDVNMHDLGVCSPPNGRKIVSAIASSATLWYFFDVQFNSSPKIRFNLVGAENQNSLRCTTHGATNPYSNSRPKNFFIMLGQCSF